MALELVEEGVMSLERVVHKTSHAPAKMFGIAERGYLREGYWADLVLVGRHQPQTVKREDILYKCGWSPLEGDTLNNSILQTFVNGELKYDHGQFIGEANGRRLVFER